MRTEKWETGGKVGNEEDIGKERSESRWWAGRNCEKEGARGEETRKVGK